jgi:hypothetical protein
MDLDTFLTQLYVWIDNWYKTEMAHQMQRHAGPACKMSDSEVLTVAIAGQWRVGVPWQSERGVVRYMLKHGRGWFPQMLQKSQFNARVRCLWAALVRLQQRCSAWLETSDDLYECVDCTELPSCSLAQAASADRHWLDGQLGRGGNNGGWFYGEQLLLSVSATGAIRGWLVGMATIDDRWMMEALLSTRQQRMQLIGPELSDKKRYQIHLVPSIHTFSPAICAGYDRALPYLVDQGFNGDRWLNHWINEYHTTVIAVPPPNATSLWTLLEKRWLAKHRQIVETVFARLTEVFGLKRLRAHSSWGKLTRLATMMAAYNLGLYLNRCLNRPVGALATLIL